MRKLIKIKNKLSRFFRFFFQVRSKNFYNFNFFLQNNNDFFSYLCSKYGTDKGFFDLTLAKRNCHNYSAYYNQIFSHCRKSIKLVFECGIGTNNTELVSSMGKQAKPGASLRVWRDYFPNASVYGADIDKKILFKERGIKTFFVNQLDSQSIKKMWKKINKKNFDLIVDDGLHTFDAGINLFKNSINFLSKNGMYIIEDVAYKDLVKYVEYFDNSRKFIVTFVNLTLNPKVAGDSTIINIRYLNKN